MEVIGMDVDLKLLMILDEVYKTGSVSRAAANIGMTQPSISIALAKLRNIFNDPLFVRTSRGMEPTPHALAVMKPVREAIALLHSTLGQQVVFDPLKSTRAFRIAMADISQVVMLPDLMTYLEAEAPSVAIDMLHISQETPRALETGDADLVRSKLTPTQFLAEAHIEVITPGTGHHQVVERAFRKQRVARRIALHLPNYLGVGLIVANTDLLVIVPERVAEILSRENRVKVVACPIALPSYQVKQHWHERYVGDPANVWLRGTISRLFSG
jgi:DNA-binding transcriptional LysR family regulator